MIEGAVKKINNIIYSNPKQAVLPMLIQDYLDICDPVLTFDRCMGEIALENQCKVNLRFIYLIDHQAPSYRTFGYFINEVLADSIEEIFQDILIEVFLVSIGQNLYKYRNKQKKGATAA